jgi:hypothetical protein
MLKMSELQHCDVFQVMRVSVALFNYIKNLCTIFIMFSSYRVPSLNYMVLNEFPPTFFYISKYIDSGLHHIVVE